MTHEIVLVSMVRDLFHLSYAFHIQWSLLLISVEDLSDKLEYILNNDEGMINM